MPTHSPPLPSPPLPSPLPLPLLDKLGVAFIPAKSDVSGNVERLAKQAPVGAATYCSLRHRMPFKPGKEGSKRAGLADDVDDVSTPSRVGPWAWAHPALLDVARAEVAAGGGAHALNTSCCKGRAPHHFPSYSVLKLSVGFGIETKLSSTQNVAIQGRDIL